MSAATRPSGPPPGLHVGGYRLISRLGEGGMGVVHLAQRPGGPRVALKVMRPHVVGDDEGRRRLAQEVGSLTRVRHGRVAEVVDADPWGPVPYVATRYVPGPSLDDYVRELGPLEGEELERFGLCLAEALDAVHRVGVLHRDVKPTNVLMEGRDPVLIDFGLARVAEDPRLTHTGWLLGTPGYLAPEILHGDDATPAADVHAWGATVAFAGTGRPPYGRGPVVAIMDRIRRGEHDLTGLDEDMLPVVEAALDPDPDARPTVADLLDWLDDGSRPPPTMLARRPLPPEPPTLRAPERHTAVLPEEPWFPGLAPAPYQPAGAHPAWPAEQVPPRPTAAEGLRAGAVLLTGAVTATVAVAAAPWVAASTLLVLAWLVRSGSRTSAAAGERQRYRGRRWYDGVLMTLSAPFHLLGSIPGTLVLGLWAGGLALVAWLVAYAAALAPDTSLLLVGAGFVLGMWIGPGSGRVRRPVRRATVGTSRHVVPWLVVTVTLVALLLGLVSGLRASGTSWSPWSGPPWESVPSIGL